MAFALPQESSRLSYSQVISQHPVYLPRAPTSNQPHANSPYYQSHDAPPLDENRTPSRSIPNMTQKSPSPSAQLQDQTFVFLQQQAPHSLPQVILPAQLSGSQSILGTNPGSNEEQSASPPALETGETLADQIAKMVPPPEAIYPTFEALLSAANVHSFSHGYALVIGRSKKKNKMGFKKVLLSCDRGGAIKQNLTPTDTTARKRKTTSRKTGCMFGVYAFETSTEWTLKYRPDPQCSRHNHGPSKSATEHPAARKLDRAAVEKVRQLKEAGVSAQETLRQIQVSQPGTLLIARDVYNARAALRRQLSRTNTNRTADPANSSPEGRPSSTLYKRAAVNPEDRFREECRAEVAKMKEELECVKESSSREIESLRSEIREKDKMIERFEMFIDICNQRVMVQRERLAEGSEGPSGA